MFNQLGHYVKIILFIASYICNTVLKILGRPQRWDRKWTGASNVPPSEESSGIVLGGCIRRSVRNRLREVILLLPQYWGCHTWIDSGSRSRHPSTGGTWTYSRESSTGPRWWLSAKNEWGIFKRAGTSSWRRTGSGGSHHCI